MDTNFLASQIKSHIADRRVARPFENGVADVGATYRNFTNAQAAIAFPVTTPGSWPVSATAYLVPWFNGGCPWPSEFLQAMNQSIPLVCFWAFDHFCLFSWPVPLPKQVARATFL